MEGNKQITKDTGKYVILRLIKIVQNSADITTLNNRGFAAYSNANTKHIAKKKVENVSVITDRS